MSILPVAIGVLIGYFVLVGMGAPPWAALGFTGIIAWLADGQKRISKEPNLKPIEDLLEQLLQEVSSKEPKDINLQPIEDLLERLLQVVVDKEPKESRLEPIEDLLQQLLDRFEEFSSEWREVHSKEYDGERKWWAEETARLKAEEK